MPSTDSNMSTTDIDEVDERLRSKYMDILQSLSVADLKRFQLDKHRYKQMVISDFQDILPNVEPDTIDGRAQCISNMLNNEAPKIRGRKIKQSGTLKEKPHKEAVTDVANSDLKETKSVDTIAAKQRDQTLTESLLKELDDTLADPYDSLNSTVTLSQMDATYGEDADNDDSITKVKTVQKAQQKDKTETKTTKPKQKGQRQRKGKKKSDDQNDIRCIDKCKSDSSSDSIRCNLCMDWFHAACMEIIDIDNVGAWVCTECRKLPLTVSMMKLQLENLLSTTSTIVTQIKSLSNKFENKMEQLDDRLTALSNQQKCSDKTCTDSLSDIREDIGTIKEDVDAKTSSILSKSQTIIDKIKATPDLVSQSVKQTIKENNDIIVVENVIQKATTTANQNNNPQSISEKSVAQTTSSSEPSQKEKYKSNEPPQRDQNKSDKTKKADLTLITGSNILRGIETKFLAENVRVKSYKSAKIDTLKDALVKLDFTRYKNIVLHVGGNDIDGKITASSFREKYISLIEYLKGKGLNVYVSGLLPRGTTNVKPFNEILKNLCESMEVEFIDNHDSFVLASGKLPLEFFCHDRINLRFPGTRALVHNINEQCIILPKRGVNGHPVFISGQYPNGRFHNQNHLGRNRRQMPIH